MNAVGVIAEYNPFHNGHKFHLEEAKKLAGGDAVVVVMSGNFVQRGEPAILNKWDRTKIALEQGADLVIEIPTLFCLGNAKQYSDAAVCLLESLGCVDKFIFGSESGEISNIKAIASDLRDNDEKINNIISELSKEGYSYPRARSIAYKEMFPFNDYSLILENSNDSLAIEYLISNSNLEAHALKRNDNYSASKVRENYFNKYSIEDLVPEITLKTLESSVTSNINDWFATLRFAVMGMTSNEIDDCPSGGEGLGNRFKSYIDKTNSWDDFLQSIKSKRYTYTRLSRLCIQIILGITRNKFHIDLPKYLRILGANRKGREILSQIESKELNKLPLISNLSKQKERLDDDGLILLELDVHASDVYNLTTNRDLFAMSEYRISPIIID